MGDAAQAGLSRDLHQDVYHLQRGARSHRVQDPLAGRRGRADHLRVVEGAVGHGGSEDGHEEPPHGSPPGRALEFFVQRARRLSAVEKVLPQRAHRHGIKKI